MDSSEEIKIIYGIRGTQFRNKIQSILRGNLKEEYIDKVTDPEGMKLYDQIFTHPTANKDINYEFYELLGDQTINKSLVWYFSRRFPKLVCPEGVQVIARLKINYIDKETFAKLGEMLGLWEYVTASEEIKTKFKKTTLEDIVEAFFGATEYLIDKKIMQGAGYAICYSIITKLFDNIKISLEYDNLFDEITRLKQIVDTYDTEKKAAVFNMQPIKVEYKPLPRQKGELANVVLYVNGNEVSRGSGAKIPVAKRDASRKALPILIKAGYLEHPPEIYTKIKDYY